LEDTVLMPREKLLELGAERLTNEELVAILLRTGVKGKGVMEFSKELLNRYGSLTALLCADVREVMNVKGMGLAKAVLFKASWSWGTGFSERCQKRPG